MNKKYKIGAKWLWLIAFLVLALIFVLIWKSTHKAIAPVQNTPISQNSNQSSTPSSAPTTNKSGSASTTTNPTNLPTTNGPHDGLTYTEAVNLYGNSGYRFQFTNCHGNPGNMTIKRYSKLMLDNRSIASDKIVLKTQSFTIRGYDFAIAVAKDTGSYPITCNGGGAATIDVQP